MRERLHSLFFVLVLSVAALGTAVQAQDTPASTIPVTGKNPVIVIPGLTGTELVNANTGKTAWFKTTRAKDDDVRLPMSADLARNRDDLIAGDIIREVRIARLLPEIEIYAKLIESLEKTGGYREVKWSNATVRDTQDTFFVFPYDWRRDNVENARLLVQRIETLKRKLGKPNLKFDVIAHSMGGLITRYAAMYGNADIPAGKLKPTWTGGRHFNKVLLVGTPNEGSLLAFDAILNGVSYIGGGIKLPFVQDLSRYDVFTIPSIFQLLPHDGTLLAYDEQLKPLTIDLYDPMAWEEYDWAIWEHDDFSRKFNDREQKGSRGYFRAVLARAKRFQDAINAPSSGAIPVSFYLVGAQCKDTRAAMIMRRDEKKDRWITQFNADSFENSIGEKITSEQLKELIYTPGDSVVPKASLEAAYLKTNGVAAVLPIAEEYYQCESHSKLVSNPVAQAKLFSLLAPETTSQATAN